MGLLLGVLLIPVAGIATLVTGFLGNALGRSRQDRWVSLGAADQLTGDAFQKFVLKALRRHAWIEKETAVVVYARQGTAGAPPVAILSKCTHLGCSVRWEAEQRHFLCPCHGGVFDESGAVLEGPPPAPLPTLETKIEGGECFVALPASGGAA